MVHTFMQSGEGPVDADRLYRTISDLRQKLREVGSSISIEGQRQRGYTLVL
jgi:DNA-binding winged helix-turn-helix (wHTH) protein